MIHINDPGLDGCPEDTPEEWAQVEGPTRYENGARIVACVNACEGIEDPSVVPDLVKALEALVRADNGTGSILRSSTETWDDYARAILAKARGESHD